MNYFAPLFTRTPQFFFNLRMKLLLEAVGALPGVTSISGRVDGYPKLPVYMKIERQRANRVTTLSVYIDTQAVEWVDGRYLASGIGAHLDWVEAGFSLQPHRWNIRGPARPEKGKNN